MSSQALRHLSMFFAAAIIIWACQTCCRFSYILRFAGTVLIFFYLILSIFLFSSALLRDQKWGMDLLGISGFFSQRTHTRNFCGSHPRVTFLATHKVFLFSSQYSDSLAILCCAYRTSYTTPTEACCRRRENLTKQRGQNQLPRPQFLMWTAIHPPRNIPPNRSLFQLPAMKQPLPQWTSMP